MGCSETGTSRNKENKIYQKQVKEESSKKQEQEPMILKITGKKNQWNES